VQERTNALVSLISFFSPRNFIGSRVHIPSRRSLRPDPNFDKLIVKIYGDVKVLEKQEEKGIKISVSLRFGWGLMFRSFITYFSLFYVGRQTQKLKYLTKHAT